MGILDKIGNAYKSSMEEVSVDRDLPPAVLPEEYEDFILDLPGEVRENVDRLKTIFKNNPQPILNYLNEIKDKGNSDYLDKGIFKEYDIVNEKDAMRFGDYKALGKGLYDSMYRKDEAGSIARKKIISSKIGQLAVGPGAGLYTGVRGTAELISSLSDLYLDTETLDNVRKVLPEMNLDEIYGDDAGGIAKFTSLLTQYGTGFAIANKIAKNL